MTFNFEKAFFPTEEEKQRKFNLLARLHKEKVAEYMNQGMSEEEAEEQIEKDIVEFMSRGYYS